MRISYINKVALLYNILLTKYRNQSKLKYLLYQNYKISTINYFLSIKTINHLMQ